jgi:hypothetical protein
MSDDPIPVKEVKLKKVRSYQTTYSEPEFAAQSMMERDDAVNWREFNQVYYETIRENCPKIPFHLLVLVEDGVIYWRTYLKMPVDVTYSDISTLVSENSTDYDGYENGNKHPEFARELALDQAVPRLKLAYKTFMVGGNVEKVLETDTNCRKMEYEAQEKRYSGVISESTDGE